MNHLSALLFVGLLVVVTKNVVSWQLSPKCDGGKHADWMDCDKSYSCSDPKKITYHSCNNTMERFDASTGKCTTNFATKATCLDDRFNLQGKIDESHGMKFYQVGSGPDCVIFNYDVYGMNNKRTKLLCDLIAAQGYQVIMPDYFQGKYFDDNANIFGITYAQSLANFKAKHTNRTKLDEDIIKRVFPYGASRKCGTYKTIGTSWGSYMVLRLSSYTGVVAAGISIHPEHPSMFMTHNIDARFYLPETVKVPQLYLVAGDCDASVKYMGRESQILGSKLKIVEFKDQKHGFTTRGDWKKSSVRSDVVKAMIEVRKFLKTTPPFLDLKWYNSAASDIKVSPLVVIPLSIILCISIIFLS